MENKKYLLHFTAEEIDQRLKDIENKQDKIEPGNYLEIENGILKMTLGQETEKTIEVAGEEIVRFDNLTFESDSSFSLFNRITYGKGENEPEYFWSPVLLLNNGPEYLETLNVNLTTPDGDTFKYITKADFVVDDMTMYIFCNITMSEGGYFVVEDTNKPGFLILFLQEDGIYYSSIQSLSDLSGSIISVVKNPTLEKETIKLPDGALKGENFIEIKDGVIRTTFGQTITKEKTICIFDNYIDFSLDETNNLLYTANSTIRAEKTLPAIGSNTDIYLIIEDYSVDKEYLATYNNIKVQLYEKTKTPILFVNTEQTTEEILENGFVKIDETKPAFTILWVEYNDVEGRWYCEAMASEDLTNIYFKIFNKSNQASVVKIPYTALPEIDQSELSGLQNHLVSSYLLNDLLDNKQNRLSFDSYPIEGSQNIVNSNGICQYVKTQISDNATYQNGFGNQSLSMRGNYSKPTGIQSLINNLGRDAYHSQTYTPSDIIDKYLEVKETTIENLTETEAKIYLVATDSVSAQKMKNKIEESGVIEILRLDTNETYYLNIGSISLTDNTISFTFSFVPGLPSFSLAGNFTAQLGDFSLYPKTGNYSYSEGYQTQAYGDYSHVQGKYNIIDRENKYAHIVGNGTSDMSRSNAYTLDWAGNAQYAGSVETTAIILTSPNGTRFKITVDDNGVLRSTQII